MRQTESEISAILHPSSIRGYGKLYLGNYNPIYDIGDRYESPHTSRESCGHSGIEQKPGRFYMKIATLCTRFSNYKFSFNTNKQLALNSGPKSNL